MSMSSEVLTQCVGLLRRRFPSWERSDALHAIAECMGNAGVDAGIVDALRAAALSVYLLPVSKPRVPADPEAASPDIYVRSAEDYESIVPAVYTGRIPDQRVRDTDMFFEVPAPIDLLEWLERDGADFDEMADFDDWADAQSCGSEVSDSWCDECDEDAFDTLGPLTC